MEARFDAVISSMVMHHIPDTKALFERIRSLLNDGGRIAFADLYKEDGSFHDDNSGVHHFGFEPDSLKTLLEATGFTDIAFHTAYTFQKAKEYPVFLMTARKA
jgi:2-polyprenyl-3-methyl-5-hydroxy-6-metoxy-1,4-benzoquinol methylase